MEPIAASLYRAERSGSLRSRDVLGRSGSSAVIVLEGINDLGFPHIKDASFASQDVTADRVISSYIQMIERAHDHGVRVYGGTLTPFEGCFYHTTAGEAKREANNTWIRSSGKFDVVIEFDAAVRDPKYPKHMAAEDDSGDHLHPRDAGYQKMEEAIDLPLFDLHQR